MLRYMDCIYETGKDLLSAWRFPFFDFRLFRDALHVRRRRLKAIAQLFSRMALSRTDQLIRGLRAGVHAISWLRLRYARTRTRCVAIASRHVCKN